VACESSGTINWPKGVKKRRGRQPAPARLCAYKPDAVYPANAFPPARSWSGSRRADIGAFLNVLPKELPKAGGPEMECLKRRGEEVHNRVIAIVENTFTPEYGFAGDRSAAVHYVACELVRSDASEEEMVAILTDRAYKISEHVHDQKKPQAYAARQVARAREEVAREKETSVTPHWPDANRDGSPRNGSYRNARQAIQRPGITCERSRVSEGATRRASIHQLRCSDQSSSKSGDRSHTCNNCRRGSPLNPSHTRNWD
jgi:hypothetical protein